MPRRIPDYPDAYTHWNQIASLGSFLSIFATIVFLYVLYNMLKTNFIVTKQNIWKSYDSKDIKRVPAIQALPLLAVVYDSPMQWQ